MEHPRNALARACDILHKTTAVIKWEEAEKIGPAHATTYEYAVKICGQEYGRGRGTSIQKAKNAAATVAVLKLREENPDKKL